MSGGGRRYSESDNNGCKEDNKGGHFSQEFQTALADDFDDHGVFLSFR